MRRFSLAMMCLAAAGLMTMVSCRKPNVNNVVPGAPRTVTLNAVTESNGGSKTYIEGLDVKWSANDVIYVNGTGIGNQLTLASEPGSTFGSFSSQSFTAEAPYMVAYPQPTEISQSEITFTIPADQSSYNNGDGYDLERVLPMAAYTTDGNADLAFKNMVNVLKLNLTGTQTITKIEVESATENLSGSFTVGTGLTPSYIALGTKKITIDYKEDPLALSTEPTVYVVLPVFRSAENTVTVKFTGDEGEMIVGPKALTGSKTPNHRYTAALTVTLEELPVFSVSNDNGVTITHVEFAPGNLWYGEDGGSKEKTWHFETNQWDYTVGDPLLDDPYEGYYYWNPSHICHFYWSKSVDVAVAEAYEDNTYTTSDRLFTEGPGFEVDGETGWRTLSFREWCYLLGFDPNDDPDSWWDPEYETNNCRDNARNLRGFRLLTDVNVLGLVILPDKTDNPGTVLASINTSADLALANAVFLPGVGARGNDGGGTEGDGDKIFIGVMGEDDIVNYGYYCSCDQPDLYEDEEDDSCPGYIMFMTEGGESILCPTPIDRNTIAAPIRMVR